MLFPIEHHPSRRQLAVFGLIWLVFFTAAGAAVWYGGGAPAVAAAFWGLAAAIPLAGLVWPGLLRIVYLVISYATFPIGLVISFVVLAAVYYLVLTPIGLILRLAGYDPMRRRFDPNAKTYWSERKQEDQTDRYFRQF